MGEIQGNLWASLVFIISFGALSLLIMYAMGIMEVNGTIKVMEDSIATGNYQYYKELDNRYNVCDEEPVNTYEDCTGIVEITDDYIKYQISYSSLNYTITADGADDHIVMLPY